MAAKNTTPTAAIDSVLAEFGRKSPAASQVAAKRIPSRDTKPRKQPTNGVHCLQQLFDHLFPADLEAQLRTVAESLAGTEFGSLETNRLVVDRLNRILRGSDFVLVSDEGTPVRLRLVKPARSQFGYFQLRSADAHQNTVYSGAKFPTLRVVEKP